LTKGEFRDDKIRRRKQFKLEEETQQRPVRDINDNIELEQQLGPINYTDRPKSILEKGMIHKMMLQN